MGRPKGDPHYWNQFSEEDGKWKCKHCNLIISGGFSRIKAHIDQQKGKGVSICNAVHRRAANGNDRVHNTSNSSDPPQVVNYTSKNASQGSIAEQEEQVDVNGGFESEMSELNKLVSDLTSEEKDIEGQSQWLESRGKKRKTNVDTWLNRLQDLKKRAVDMENSVHQFGPVDLDDGLEIEQALDVLRQKLAEESRKRMVIQQLTEAMQAHKEMRPLVLSNEFVGRQFELYVKKMWRLLKDDRVFIIGICGMGGVGKTFLATYMENGIERNETFKDVFWVTVSHHFNIFKLQHDIAETIGVKLYRYDERTRATILASNLEKREKSLLILDDVWEYIDLQKVGIPLKVNGIKLIITTRLKHVCRQMDCLPENTITMYPLYHEEEAWELFLLKLGYHGTPATIPPEVLEIAKSIIKKCDGLPLGIGVMARTMKGGGNDIHRWRDALNKLNKLEMREEMKEEVLTVLKRSYDYLNEKDIQKCFLYCAMLPYGYEKEDLVTILVKYGLLNGKKSLEEIFDAGHVMVNNLIEQSLLEWKEEDNWIAMNGMVRNMACYTWKQSHVNVMVKCGQYLTKIPHVREWAVDLEAVSLTGNSIGQIPDGISPNCPCLSTLILSHTKITDIPECFFTHINALKLLDLSNNRKLISLPNSLSNLRSLTSLLLSGCSKLEFIPPLGELQALSTLDISRCCSILQAPQGLQNLTNLKWLDMFQNKNSTLSQLPGCVLASLTNMQYLDLRGCSGIKAEDVKGMTMLECFAGSFLDQDNYNRYVRQIQDGGYGPQNYNIHLDNCGRYDDEEKHSIKFNHRSIWLGDCEKLSYLLPRDLRELSVRANNQWAYLCEAFSSNGSSSLKKVNVSDCTELKSLFCLSRSCSSCTSIRNLESLYLRNLKSLTSICKEDADFTQSLSSTGVFSHLMHFEIVECHEIKTLLTSRLVAQLQNLGSIIVSSCHSMEKIFDDDSFTIKLPKLTKLKLARLPELKTVCNGILFCGSENILNIYDCPNKEELHRNTSCVVYD